MKTITRKNFQSIFVKKIDYEKDPRYFDFYDSVTGTIQYECCITNTKESSYVFPVDQNNDIEIAYRIVKKLVKKNSVSLGLKIIVLTDIKTNSIVCKVPGHKIMSSLKYYY